MTARPIRLLLGFFTVGSWTMASRVLGFVRDILIAAFLGAGPVAEAFFVAFRLPNMFRRFFAEGAFNMAFVPLFAKKLEGEGQDAARKFGTEALSALAMVLLIFTVIAQIAMPWFVYGLASGYSGAEKFDLAVLYSRIVFPDLARRAVFWTVELFRAVCRRRCGPCPFERGLSRCDDAGLGGWVRYWIGAGLGVSDRWGRSIGSVVVGGASTGHGTDSRTAEVNA